MIISRTPYRISFFGGGTDYPAWYRKHGGSVLSTTIDKYCYLTCRYLPPFFEHRIRIVYSKIENCQIINNIQHPAVREALRYLNINRGVEIHHDGDLPARSGMGTSSSFVVGLLNALYALKGIIPSKQQLAMNSIEIEQIILKEIVGSQDQISAAYGGINHIEFMTNGEITVKPLTVSRERTEELNSFLMLFYTGIKRTASNIAESYVTNIESRKRQFRIMKDLVNESIYILGSGQDIINFGELLNEAWETKRNLSSVVSNQQVDNIYSEACSAGALGGKLTGAGGGGFLLLFVPPAKRQNVYEKLNSLLHIPFNFEFSGSQIIFFDPEKDYLKEEKARAKQPVNSFRELDVHETVCQ